MAVPYGLWSSPGLTFSSASFPFGYGHSGGMGGGLWAVPGIPASANPLISDPEGAIRDFVEALTNGNRDVGPDERELMWIEEWAKTESYRKVIIEVLKARIDLAWPYNYKTLQLLGKMPASTLADFADKLSKLADSAQTVTGFKHLKELAKPLHEKAKAEVAKKEEEEATKRQEAIMAMWGGLWTNAAHVPAAIQSAGWGGWPYPHTSPPGVQYLGSQWAGKPPDDWKPTPITSLPQVYPFSRTGYYGLQPEPLKNLPPPTSLWTVHVGLRPFSTDFKISKTLPLGLREIQAQADKDLACRGW
ncbi:hypothetical protein IAU60_005050 [Kwoniella sp. DSM 27419]